MNKKIIIVLAILIGSVWLGSHASYKMVCLKKARSGEDQKLYGHYHCSYATADNHHCYFTFDPEDIVWISLREAKKRPELKDFPYLPSYKAKVLYFINSEPYTTIIEALKKPGKTLKHLRSLENNAEAPVFKSYKDVLEEMPKLTE